MPLDATNDPNRRSWVKSANGTDADFPIQNLPIGTFRQRGSAAVFRGGVAIGDQILDLAALAATDVLKDDAAEAVAAGAGSTLNVLMQQGPKYWTALRNALFAGLTENSTLQPAFLRCLIPQALAEYAVPAQIGDFTDFYSSVHHATAVGRLFRPDNPLTPNYKWMPIGYHGRSSSIGVSEQSFHRPQGQRLPPGELQPVVGPSARLDYELELGVFLGSGNALGSQIPVTAAESHVFGLCLLNDWSARDIQAWEYQPSGSVSREKLRNDHFAVDRFIAGAGTLSRAGRESFERPRTAGYLVSASNDAAGGFDIRLEAYLQSASMQDRREPPQRLSSAVFATLIGPWRSSSRTTPSTDAICAQVICSGTGTQSGPTPEEAGSLLELSSGGTRPIRIGSTEQRTFLQDGDTVIFRAWCAHAGRRPHWIRRGAWPRSAGHCAVFRLSH